MILKVGKTKLHIFRCGERVLPVDYHIHTNYSDGKDGIEMCILKAKERGLKEIAILDHVWRTSEWVDDYVNEIRELSEKYNFTVHAGLEAKVVDFDGNVDVSRSDRKKVDFVMGVVHRHLPDEEKPYNDLSNLEPLEVQKIEVTLIKRMIASGKVNLIGHPTRIFYKLKSLNVWKSKNLEFKKDLISDLVDFASSNNAILELNTNLPNFQVLLAMYLKKNNLFTIGSDSHTCDSIGSIDYKKLDEIISGCKT